MTVVSQTSLCRLCFASEGTNENVELSSIRKYETFLCKFGEVEVRYIFVHCVLPQLTTSLIHIAAPQGHPGEGMLNLRIPN